MICAVVARDSFFLFLEILYNHSLFAKNLLYILIFITYVVKFKQNEYEHD